MFAIQPSGCDHREVTPVGQQATALEQIAQWYRDPTGPQVFKLFGYAGTGKTTLAQHVVDMLGLRGDTLFAAYSGKAAHVLRRKGCDGASTIHALIYEPVVGSHEQIVLLQALRETTDDPAKLKAIDAAIVREKRKLERPTFERRNRSTLEDARLLILDEVSMVNTEIARDLLSFGTRILCLGDPAQLPPIEGAGYFINGSPDAMLTEVHRSASDSPVTRIATAIRQAAPTRRDLGVPGPDGDSGRFTHPGNLLDYDQVICGTNATRWALINGMRRMQGRTDPEPMPADRIMTLVNSRDAQVLNGQQFTVLDRRVPSGPADKLDLVVRDEEGTERDLTVWRAGFHGHAGEQEAKTHRGGPTAVATYANAITCHKAQGSQWDRVLIVDESRCFRGDAQRWMYTAVTRAAEQAVIVDRRSLR